MNQPYHNLFSPIEIRGRKLRNRVVQSAHDAPNAMVAGDLGFSNFSENLAHYMGLIARGGAAVVNTGHLGVDPRFKLGSNGMFLNFFSGDSIRHHQLPVMHLMTDMVHSYGALASIEFNHGGHYCAPIEGNKVFGPMSMTMENGLEVVAMDSAEMERVAEYFAAAANIGKKAGFDMINIHAAHNWLLGEFFSPLTNRRNDEFGGSVENRARFPLKVLRYIRERIGGDMLISVRFSASELVEGGITLKDSIETIKMISDYADIVHCSVGKIHNIMTSSYIFPTQYTEHGVNTYLAASIKKEVTVPIEAIGGINDPAMADHLIADGSCDLVAMARSFIADPDWAQKAKEGRAEDIRPCIRCTRCLSTGVSKAGDFPCTVNPRRSLYHPLAFKPASAVSKNVIVVGGGPAGLAAASEIADKGHSVTLFEKGNKLGGRLQFADHVEFKEDLRRYRDYLITQVTKRKSINIQLDTEATREMVESLSPDAVIVAIGAEKHIPSIPGSDCPNVIHSTDIFGLEEKLGNVVLVVGGGSVGCETTIDLHSFGKTVVLSEMEDELMKGDKMRIPTERDATLYYVTHAFSRKNKKMDAPLLDNVKVYLNTRCVKITSEGGWLETLNGERFLVEADTVVMATGLKPDKALRDSFDGIAMDVIDVGDCVKAGSIFETSSSGYYASLQI